MAFGDNNDKKYYEPSVYSAYSMSNTEGIDPSAMNFQFVNGLIKISIAPLLPDAKPGDKVLWDKDNAACIWITHTKARMLASEIRALRDNPEDFNNGGVPSGAEGLISFSNGKELGATGPCIIIRKLNSENGEVTSTYAYQFKQDYHYSIRNFSTETKEFDKNFYPDLEIDQFIDVLDTYYTNMTGALSYATLYGAKYDIQKDHTKMKLIMGKLGIEQSGDYSGGGGYNNKSFFNGSKSGEAHSDASTHGAGSMRTGSIDDIAK